MSASSRILCQQDVKRNAKQHSTLKLDNHDLKIARKNGWVFAYGSICDYLQYSFINLDYAEVNDIMKEINTLTKRQNINMSDLYDNPPEDGLFVIRLSNEPPFHGCKQAQQKIGKMISKGRIPAIYVTSKAVNKLFSLQAANKNPKGKCHFCSKSGHYWSQCRIRKRNAPNWRYKDGNKVNQEITFSSISDNDDWTL